MSNFAVRELLIQYAKKSLRRRLDEPFSGLPQADALLCDLSSNPHAFVLACVMDRQIKAENAWLIPFRIRERLGGFEFERLNALDLGTLEKVMKEPSPLHRFPHEMAKNLRAGLTLISGKYRGDASNIWTDQPTSAELVYRFLEFRGVGPKIATMAANILVRRFGVKLSDYYSVDISADVHVRRVFERLGLVEPKASIEQIIYRARSLNPEFPGLLDLTTWELGRGACSARAPRCGECYMREACPTAA